jgi:nicotinate phosphoribosyltransferase
MKLSPGKKCYPWAKQVHRCRDAEGRFVADRITRADERADGEPLLVPLVRAGKLVAALPSLEVIRAHCRDQLGALPEGLLGPDAAASFPVTYSAALEAEADRVAKNL